MTPLVSLSLAALAAALLVALLLGFALGALAAVVRRAGRTAVDDPTARLLADRAGDQAVLREGLDRLRQEIHALQGQGVEWQAQLRQHVDDVRHSTDHLRRETSALATALRRPQVRGRWGELHLRRTVELAGLVEHCDFTEQASLATDAGVQRPDLVVHLAGERDLVVDSKVPLDAFLSAAETDDADEAAAHLARHARQLRTHIDQLGSKGYWKALPTTPEFVVLFVPGESFLSAALEADPDLIEHASRRNVVLATPTTLIALLRTVAHSWTQQALSARVVEIHELACQLHQRLGTVGDHLDRLGRSLSGAVGAYNSAVGSLESRVLVTARRLSDLDVGDDDLAAPRTLDDAPRPLTAVELLDAVAEPRSELGVDLEEPGPRSRRAADSEPRRLPTVGA